MHTADSRLLISGAHSEDDSIAARCAGIIRRRAHLFMATGADLPKHDGRKGRDGNNERLPLHRAEKIAAFARNNAHLTARQIANEMHVKTYVVRHIIKTRAIKVKPGMRKKEQCT